VAPVIDFSSSVLRGGFSSCYSIQREHEPTSPAIHIIATLLSTACVISEI
jgi:hypothetical protein